MNIKNLQAVMKKYGRAWEKQSSALLLDCFTKDGIYQESPLVQPYRGHKEIKRFWDDVVRKKTQKITFRLGKCYVSKDGQTGFAEWGCINTYLGKRQRMAGVMILKMKGKKIFYLNEYWNTVTIGSH